MENFEIELLKVVSSRETAKQVKAKLTLLLSRELNKTVGELEAVYIRTMYDIGVDTVFPKTVVPEKRSEVKKQ